MDVIKRRKTDNERQYDEEAFNDAVTAVKSGHLTSGKAALLYGVPKSTVWLNVQKWNKLGIKPELERLGASYSLTADEENSLAQYMRWCEGVSIPFSYELLRVFSYEILAKRGASKKKLSHSWARRFVQRHNLSTRKPRHISKAQEQAHSDPDNVVYYFKLLEQQMEKLDLLSKPHCVWNVDENGWSKEQAVQRPVLCTIGQHHATTRQIFTNEQITTVHCISASGAVIPPYIILSKKLLSDNVVTDLPGKWNFGSSESGFLNKELFFLWFKTTFLPNIGRERPQLLIYDAESCQISLEIVQLAMDENISIITLPGKSTAFLQPVGQILANLVSTFADVAFHLSFMKADFLVRPDKFARVLKQALKTSWTKALIQHSFKKTGVYPPSLLEISKSPQLTKECREELHALCAQEDDCSSPEGVESEASSDSDTDSTRTDTDSTDTDQLQDEFCNSPQRVEPEANSNSNTKSTQTDTDQLQGAFCVCGRLIDDPCLDCIHRYKKRHNPLCRVGIIMEGFSDVLDATGKNDPGQSRLSKAKHITGMAAEAKATFSVFLCGDVMLARGVDMIQEYSCDPVLYEGNGMDAHAYVQLAVDTNGPLPPKSERDAGYVWGYALKVLAERKPTFSVVNLETSVTTRSQPWPRKGINYRMHPKNISVLKSANIDCCALGNNHTADWGFKGLRETLEVLRTGGVQYCGAGLNADEAKTPAVLRIPSSSKRVLVFSAGHSSSGVPEKWRALSQQEGVNIIDFHIVEKGIGQLKEMVRKHKQQGDLVILSIHWGGNWGFDSEPGQTEFAHKAIDEAGVDLIHGHSSHHVKGVEVYKNKLILYGCGDFINDYEGISGYDEFRGDLSLMYFVEMECDTGRVVSLNMIPTKLRNIRVNRASNMDAQWLYRTMTRECAKFGSGIKMSEDNVISLVVK